MELTHLGDQIRVERTLAIIKPDIYEKAEKIEGFILQSGLTILQKRRLQLSQEQCSDFYSDCSGKPFFPSLMAYMSSGPIVAMVLACEDAVTRWKSIIGPASITNAKESQPECLRAKYGTSDLKNALHGSESFQEAVREIKFMFPNSFIEPSPSKHETKEYLSRCLKPVLLRGLTELCKEKPLNPVIWLADWLLQNNPNQPQTYF
ncbi:nucleoside diphosphate kinase homolog 5 isoform X1 [Oryzias latipes]|uniref:nucleoside diphosphate kinase homolog 5 isoform X1 n=1 Tax=Oryzias latipes TaxID=8090 RepID=UPI0000E9F65F|nr:nucleoside diphosphate kinase homolog 5 isoform X1 [Oryzias latipes]